MMALQSIASNILRNLQLLAPDISITHPSLAYHVKPCYRAMPAMQIKMCTMVVLRLSVQFLPSKTAERMGILPKEIYDIQILLLGAIRVFLDWGYFWP